MFDFGFRLLLLPCPPTLSMLWSIRLSIHSQKWLWHLLKRPVECSGLKGYPMLWPKTTRFFFFSLRFPSKTPLWHCALACWLSDQSLNIFKLPPMKDTPSYHCPLHTCWHDNTQAHRIIHAHIHHTEMQNTQKHQTQKVASVKPQPLQLCTFSKTSIVYDHPKNMIAKRNTPVVTSYL